MKKGKKWYRAVHSAGEYFIDTRRDHLIRVPGYLCGPICDACNEELPPEPWLLVLGLYAWGALCDECVEKYHSDLPKYVLKENYAVPLSDDNV